MQEMNGKKIQRFVSVPQTDVTYPETVIIGAREGKTVTISAGVHSREYVGMEAVNRLASELEPEQICGRLRLIHAVNYNGLIRRSSDVCPEDGKNLNRAFPGDDSGSSTQRLAAFLEREVIADSDAIMDLHSGGFCEGLTPHLYFHGVCKPEINQASQEMATYVNVPYAVRSSATNGFYSHAGQCGVPAILLERGGSGIWSEEEVLADVQDVKNVLRFLGVLQDGVAAVRQNPRVLPGGFYEDAPVSGLWYPKKKVGDRVEKGEELGQIRDAFGQLLFSYAAKEDGVLLYQTVSLGIEKNRPMIAYGIMDN